MVKFENICKAYGKNQIINGAALEAKPGEIIAIVGRNGCGKSTFLQIISGVLKPDSGSIVFWGHNALKEKKCFQKYVGYVPQENPLLEEMSVLDNLKFWKIGFKKTEQHILDRFDLNDILNQKVKNLSGGMQRRLAIACVVQRNVPVMILDEPTSALDFVYQDNILNWMKEYKNANGIIVFSTHNEREIELSDKIYIMEDGILKEVPKGDGIEAVRNIIINKE